MISSVCHQAKFIVRHTSMTYRDSFNKSSNASVLFDGVDSMSKHLTVLPDDHQIIEWHRTLSDVTSAEVVSLEILPYCGRDNEVDICSRIAENVEDRFNCRHSEVEDGSDEEDVQSLGSIPSTLISLFRNYLLNNNTLKNGNYDINDTIIDGATRELLNRSLSTITEESSGDTIEFENDLRTLDLTSDIEIDSVLGESNVDLLSQHITEQFGLNKYGNHSDGSSTSSDELSRAPLPANGHHRHSANHFRADDQFGFGFLHFHTLPAHC